MSAFLSVVIVNLPFALYMHLRPLAICFSILCLGNKAEWLHPYATPV